MVSGVTLLKVCSVLNGFVVFLCMSWQLVRTNFGCVDNGWGSSFGNNHAHRFDCSAAFVQRLTICVSIARHLLSFFFFLPQNLVCMTGAVYLFSCVFPLKNMAISTRKHVHFHWEACPFLCQRMWTVDAASLFFCVFPLGNLSISSRKHGHFHQETWPFPLGSLSVSLPKNVYNWCSFPECFH